MSPINFDARLETLFRVQEIANRHNFVSEVEKELFINSMCCFGTTPMKYNVLYSRGKPVVIDGRVQRRYTTR